jgi:hypothetical protein
MSKGLITLYRQLDVMPQTEDVIKIKKMTKDILASNLKDYFTEYMNVGKVIGYDELKEDLLTAIELVEMQQNHDSILKAKTEGE